MICTNKTFKPRCVIGGKPGLFRAPDGLLDMKLYTGNCRRCGKAHVFNDKEIDFVTVILTSIKQ